MIQTQGEMGVLWPKPETRPSCATAACGNKEGRRWLVSILPCGAVRLPGEQLPGRGSHDVCPKSASPSCLLAPGLLWPVFPSTLPQMTPRCLMAPVRSR